MAKSTEPLRILKPAIATVLVVAGLVLSYFVGQKSGANQENMQPNNSNSLFYLNPATPPEMVEIPIAKPVSLNYLMRKDVLKLRRDEIEKFPYLLNGSYTPCEAVFGQMEDKKPWWGIVGAAYYGKGNRSIEGMAEESRYLLNPYLLVGLNSGTCDIIDKTKFDEKELSKPDFPFFWEPSKLTWWPGQAKAEAIYDVSGFQSRIAKYPATHDRKEYENRFMVVLYNARDFNLNYWRSSPTKSKNVVNKHMKDNAVWIEQMIHCGDTCGFPGGCNNMSPGRNSTDEWGYTALPAELHVEMWKQKPTDANAVPPDFTFVVHLQ